MEKTKLSDLEPVSKIVILIEIPLLVVDLHEPLCFQSIMFGSNIRKSTEFIDVLCYFERDNGSPSIESFVWSFAYGNNYLHS